MMTLRAETLQPRCHAREAQNKPSFPRDIYQRRPGGRIGNRRGAK
jgi:hypothetical protein